MAKWFNGLCGLLMPDTVAPRDIAPAPIPPRMIPGGPAAPELCMLPVEWSELDEAAAQEAQAPRRDVRVAQLKADGINAMYVDGRVVGGRDGGPLDCALHCAPGLARLERAYGQAMVLLGEYVAHDGFNATLAEHRRGEGTGAFWLYDAVPFDAWSTGREYPVAIEDRLSQLRQVFTAADTGMFVGVLDFWLLDAGEMRAKAAELWAAGYEGLVSKERGSGFARARDRRWRKVKKRFRAPCQVVDTIMRDGVLRSIIVRGPEPSAAKPMRLTGGWSADDGRAIQIGMEKGGGRVVEVSFELTVGATRTVRAPRFEGVLA